MRYLSTVVVALLSVTLVCMPMTGCTVSQAKINSVVQDVANWAPVISADATTLMTEIAVFEPQDAAQIQSYVAQIQANSAALTTLCKTYLAAPSTSVMTQISVLVSSMATNDSAALLQVLQIKDANSKQIAQGILTTIATAVTILATYLNTVHVAVTPAATTSLNQMKPYLNRRTLDNELQTAKTQGLVPVNVSLAQFGY